MLIARGIEVYYGAIRAVDRVDLDVRAGEIVTLLGANGAGKTTLLKSIAGLVRPRGGELRFDSQSIDRLPTHVRVRRGLVLVPEGRGILARMTVLENLQMGACARDDHSSSLTRSRAMLDRFPRLAERQHLPAGVLSGGEQQILAIARALLIRPKLLLIDEPSLGLAPQMIRLVFDLLVELRSEGVTLLLVEQNARQALEISDRGYVLQNGRMALTGTAKELRANDQIKEAYLGVET